MVTPKVSKVSLDTLLPRKNGQQQSNVGSHSKSQQKDEFQGYISKEKSSKKFHTDRKTSKDSDASISLRSGKQKPEVQNGEKLSGPRGFQQSPINGQEAQREVPQQKLTVVSQKGIGERQPLAERENVQMQFLVNMHNDLGVDPGEVVAAFSDLSARELAAPPEKTVAKLVASLGLQGEEAEKAKEMFYGMLAETATMDLGTDSADNKKLLSMEVMTEKELSIKNRDKSLNAMNASFFTAPAAVGAASATPMAQAATKGANQVVQNRVGHNIYRNMQNEMAATKHPAIPQEGPLTQGATQAQSLGEMSLAAPMKIEGMMPTSQNTVTPQPPVIPQAKSSQSSVSMQDLQSQGMKLENQADPIDAEIKEMVQQSSARQGTMNPQKPVVDMSGMAKEMSGKNVNFSAMSAEGEATAEVAQNGITAVAASESAGWESADLSQGESQTEQHLKNFGEARVQTSNAQNAGKGEFIVQTPKASDGDQAANVREVVNQARYIIKNGGGQMKVHLAPAGLGEVNLKVSMSEGKINVEMITSNNDAKKVMEKGLGDLKATLAGLKLNVDDIKVDVAQETNNQLEQDGQEESKNFQQKFLENFQRENNRFRNFALDQSGVPTSGSQLADRAEEAHEVNLHNSRSSGKGSGRLNLVA